MGDVAGPAVTVGGGQSFHQVPAGKIGAADVTDFSAADEDVERAENFFDGSERVETVELEKIDVIGFEAAQAAFDGVDQMEARRADVVRARTGFECGFGGDENFVAAAGNGAAENSFGFAVGVNVSAVEHVGAGFEANVNEAGGFGDAGISPGAEKFVAA